MKQTNKHNQIWFEETAGVVRIGFTRSFLDTLDQCWHIIPANTRVFKQKAPLLIVETSDALISIESPVSGSLLDFGQTARDFPDLLQEDSVVMSMNVGAVAPVQVGMPDAEEVNAARARLRAQGIIPPLPEGMAEWQAGGDAAARRVREMLRQQQQANAVRPAGRPQAPAEPPQFVVNVGGRNDWNEIAALRPAADVEREF